MKQKGQALLEFAFVVPFMTVLLLAIIYVGMFFVDLIHYNNAVRYAARDIALRQTDGTRTERVANIESGDYVEQLTELYTPKMSAAYEGDAVKVTLNLKRKVFGSLLETFIVLPKEFDIEYRMKIENRQTIEIEQDTDTDTDSDSDSET